MKPILAALALATFIPGVALAVPKPDDVTQAKAHFKKGTQLYRQARYRDAIVEFEAAYRAKPHAVMRYNIAQCHEKLGDITAGLKNYHGYLREAPKARDRSTVLAVMARLEKRLAAAGVQQLLLYSDPPDVEVSIDGLVQGRTPFSTVLPHGRHGVRLVKPGYQPLNREVELLPAQMLALELAMEKAVEPAPAPVAEAPVPALVGAAHEAEPKPDLTPSPPSPLNQPIHPAAKAQSSRLWTWVALGTAAAAAGAATYFGLTARNASSRLTDGTSRPQAQAQALYDDARSNSQTASVFMAVAGATGAAGVTLYFLEGSF